MRRRKRTKEKQEKRKNRRPILKKLCAALLRLFRGQHSEKMKGSGVPKATGTAPPCEAAVDWCKELFIVLGIFYGNKFVFIVMQAMLYKKPRASCRSPTALKRPDRSKQCHRLPCAKFVFILLK